jgi:hypothetical protein
MGTLHQEGSEFHTQESPITGKYLISHISTELLVNSDHDKIWWPS